MTYTNVLQSVNAHISNISLPTYLLSLKPMSLYCFENLSLLNFCLCLKIKFSDVHKHYFIETNCYITIITLQCYVVVGKYWHNLYYTFYPFILSWIRIYRTQLLGLKTETISWYSVLSHGRQFWLTNWYLWRVCHENDNSTILSIT